MNGAGSREITTLFPGDLIQTEEDSVANIVAGGSSALVMPNASVKFLGAGVEPTAGSVSIATSEGMAVSAYGLSVRPLAHGLSKFEFAEFEDSVFVAARLGNVTVTDGRRTATVQERQEVTYKKASGLGGEVARSIAGKTLAGVGGGSGATVAGILIAESKKNKRCVSPSGDKKCKCKKDKNGKDNCEEND